MSTSFRRHLALRLLGIAALAAPVAASSTQGCLVTPAGTCSGAPPPGPVGAPVMVCIDQPPPDPADASPTVDGCPVSPDADAYISESPAFTNETGNFTIQSGPVMDMGKCCYEVQPMTGRCIGGRPFLVDLHPLLAPPDSGACGWSDTEAPLPHTGDLSAELRAELAERWTRDGLAEHASIASFARFSLELLAAGAPADLVELAHRAARDEVRHARLCFSLAGAYAGEPVGPGAFPLGDRVAVTSDLASIAARAAREGCVGETIAAVVAAEQLARATDPAVRAALAIIAADEARHAELAWRTVAWAVNRGGAPVRAAVAAALGSLDSEGEAAPQGEGRLDRYGQLDAGEHRRVAGRAIVEVVGPAARVLLSASSPG